jgi:hypothetical protein
MARALTVSSGRQCGPVANTDYEWYRFLSGRPYLDEGGNGDKAKADISIYGQESNYTIWRLA